MAKQSGTILLRGTIGDITFYQSKDGWLAKKKSSLTKDRINNDAAFKQTRENATEFARACTAGKFLIAPFKPLLKHTRDRLMFGRLTKLFIQILHSDVKNIRGKRKIEDGELSPLKGFEFNKNACFSDTFHAPYVILFKPIFGDLTVTIPAFSPSNTIVSPAGATHFKIWIAAAFINFKTGSHDALVHASNYFSLSIAATAPLFLNMEMTASSQTPLFILMGIEFIQEANGLNYPLQNGIHNVSSVVEVRNVC